jgi:hypothetical protein
MRRIFLIAILSGLLAFGGFNFGQRSLFQTQPADTPTPESTPSIPPSPPPLPTPNVDSPTLAPTEAIPTATFAPPTTAPTQAIPTATFAPPTTAPTQAIPTATSLTPTPAPTQAIPTATLPPPTPTPRINLPTPKATQPTQVGIPTTVPTIAPTPTLSAGSQTPSSTMSLPVDTPLPTPSVLDPGSQGTFVQPTLDPALTRLIKAGTIITLVPPTDTTPGGSFLLSGTIRDWSGYLVANASITFTINGSYLGQTRSDKKGFFQQNFKKVLAAGIYAITATFNGTRTLSYSSAATTLNVVPTGVTVQTVPPVTGVTFELGGTQFVTGDDGSATIKVDKPGNYRLVALVGLYDDPTQRIDFGRWLEDNYQPFKDVAVPTKGVIQVGLNIFNQVGETFVDLDGVPVDPQRISQFTLRSEQGDVFVLNNGQPRWLPASRITRRVDGLVITQLLYSVINVKVDGSNVVNSSQQQFYAGPNDTWKITLLLYSLRVKVSDGLFGSASGKSINLHYPDGQVTNYPLDSAGIVEIHGLARGNYTIEIIGVKGLGNRIPVALSRNQNANVKVLTYVDISIVGFIGVLIALSLLLYGRRKSLISARLKRQHTIPGVDGPLFVSDGIQSAENNPAPPKDEIIKWS